VFRAADRELVIAVGNDKQFRALASVLGVPALADDVRYASNTDRVAHRDELRGELEQALAAASAGHWVDGLVAAGVPAGLVNDVAEAIAFAEGLGLGPVAETPPAGGLGHAHRSVANPIGLAGSPPAHLTPPPDLGEHDGADWLPRP
jgi:crotonobetainyl-CoA:carnitine CoA-transferase CaiB-like acyl-CoA transferase